MSEKQIKHRHIVLNKPREVIDAKGDVDVVKDTVATDGCDTGRGPKIRANWSGIARESGEATLQKTSQIPIVVGVEETPQNPSIDAPQSNIVNPVLADDWDDEHPTLAPKRQARQSFVNRYGNMTAAEARVFRNINIYTETNRKLVQDTIRDARITLLDSETTIKNNVHNTIKNIEDAQRKTLQIQRFVTGTSLTNRRRRIRYDWKDQEILLLIGKFKFVTARHLSYAHNCGHETTYRRLIKLRKMGLVVNNSVYGTEDIWLLTQTGAAFLGEGYEHVGKDKIKFSTFPHRFGLTYLACNLWGGKLNVLDIENFGELNRTRADGKPEKGEEIVSEREIRSAYGGLKFNYRTYAALVGHLKSERNQLWTDWGQDENSVSPEFVRGHEWLWILFPDLPGMENNYHIPDLVVARPRSADNSPGAVAVELELSLKSAAEYERILRIYQDDNRFYRKVVWVTNNAKISRVIQRKAEEIGFWGERIDVLPVITERGVWERRDLWSI